MARLFSSGFELNSNTVDMEWTKVSGSPTIQTTTVRSGTYAGEISGLTALTPKYWGYNFISSSNAGPFYFRFYFRYHTLPTTNDFVCALSQTSSLSVNGGVRLTTAGKLQLFSSGVAQQGADSSVLTVDTWYRVEILVDNTGGAAHCIMTLLLDGVQQATATTLTSSNTQSIFLGGNLNSENQTTADWFFDDIAVNDSTGTSQTSYPGSGNIMHLRPNAAGDNTGFGGGSAGTEYNQVNEVPPDDGTTARFSHTTAIDDFGVDNTPAAIGASDTINLVSIGFRFAVDVTGGTAGQFKVRAKKTASGTVSSGTTVTTNSTSYQTNATAAPRNATLTLYQDPDAGSWTKTTLDSMQIGVQLANNPTNTPRYTNVWALVDWTPSGTPATSAPDNWPILTGSHWSGPRFS